MCNVTPIVYAGGTITSPKREFPTKTRWVRRYGILIICLDHLKDELSGSGSANGYKVNPMARLSSRHDTAPTDTDQLIERARRAIHESKIALENFAWLEQKIREQKAELDLES